MNNENNENVVEELNSTTNSQNTEPNNNNQDVIPVDNQVEEIETLTTDEVKPVEAVDTKKEEVIEPNQQPIDNNVVQETNVNLDSNNVVQASTSSDSSNQATDTTSEPTKEASTFKRIMGIVLFFVFLALVYFMPEINKFINDYKNRNKAAPVITTGVSTCTLSKTEDNFDIVITASFSIVNSKLTKLTYVTVTSGDKTKDKEELDEIYNKCTSLKKEAGELDGVLISCSSNNGNITNKQILDYEKLDSKKVTSAYTEAGGIYPEFTKGENIDKIESKMTSAGYSCTRK